MVQFWSLLALLTLFYSSPVALADDAQEILSETAKQSNASLLWGPYRPNLYFGVRPRIPRSLMTGLVWSRVDSYEGLQESE